MALRVLAYPHSMPTLSPFFKIMSEINCRLGHFLCELANYEQIKFLISSLNIFLTSYFYTQHVSAIFIFCWPSCCWQCIHLQSSILIAGAKCAHSNTVCTVYGLYSYCTTVIRVCSSYFGLHHDISNRRLIFTVWRLLYSVLMPLLAHACVPTIAYFDMPF